MENIKFYSIKEMSEELGIEYQTINGYLRRNNIQPSKNKGSKRYYSVEQFEIVKNYYGVWK